MANNKTNTASYNYYLYLNITKNEFVYTTEEQTPEILLQITKPDGTTLTSLEGLNHVTVGEVSGFDITTKKGKVTIADNKLIEVLESNTTHKTEEEWQIGITFVNLDTNQQENTNKSFVSKVMIQQEEYNVPLAEHILSTYGTDSTLYYHDSNLANGANDNSYRYAGSNPNNFVCFGSNEADCPRDNLYRIIGIFNQDNKYNVKLIKADFVTSDLLGTKPISAQTTTPQSTYKGTNDLIYEYSWTNTFSYEVSYETCNDNGECYGTHTPVDTMYGASYWQLSLLYRNSLNNNYVSSLGESWTNLIVANKWNVPKIKEHQTEYTNPTKNQSTWFLDIEKEDKTTYQAKISIMYVSDYGYAINPKYYDINLDEYGENLYNEENWLYLGEKEMTMSVAGKQVLIIDYHGNLITANPNASHSLRPTFYLNENVITTSGNGSITDPYRLS